MELNKGYEILIVIRQRLSGDEWAAGIRGDRAFSEKMVQDGLSGEVISEVRLEGWEVSSRKRKHQAERIPNAKAVMR